MATERKPIVPVSEETRQRLLTMPAFVLLGFPTKANAYQGYVEQSFSMSWSSNHVLIYTNSWGDGRKQAEEAKQDSERIIYMWALEVYDARDTEKLPIVIDWEAWIEAQAFNPNTLSGVNDKFKARNAPFKMKDTQDGKQTNHSHRTSCHNRTLPK